MRQLLILLLLIPASQSSLHAQKKKFFDNVELMFNIHFGADEVLNQGWARLFQTPNPNYIIDTFKRVEFGGGPGLRLPAASGGLRLSKTLFKNNDRKLVKDRVEWRAAFMVSTRTNSSTLFYSPTFFAPNPSTTYFYDEIRFQHRKQWLDINTQVVYKIPSFLFRRNLKYYLGGGTGISKIIGGRTTETVVRYRATPQGNGHVITEEARAVRGERNVNPLQHYFSFVCGSEIKLSPSYYILLETTGQFYGSGFTRKKRVYQDDGYISLILRYKF